MFQCHFIWNNDHFKGWASSTWSTTTRMWSVRLSSPFFKPSSRGRLVSFSWPTHIAGSPGLSGSVILSLFGRSLTIFVKYVQGPEFVGRNHYDWDFNVLKFFSFIPVCYEFAESLHRLMTSVVAILDSPTFVDPQWASTISRFILRDISFCHWINILSAFTNTFGNISSLN